MKKEDLLKQIAKKAYNVGFGAKKSFASFELLNLISKVPVLLSFISVVIGIFSLFRDELSTKELSAILTVFGVSSMLLGCYTKNKNIYEKNGKDLTVLYNNLEKLYFLLKNSDGVDAQLEQFQKIQDQYSKVSITEQVFLSNEIAHYKFFWEQQIDWIDKELRFKLFRDKIPFSINCLIAITVLFLLGCGIMFFISLI